MRSSSTSWIVPALLAASVIYSIYLGFRVSGLERELAELQPGAAAGKAPTPWPEERGGPVAGVASPARPPRPATVEARLDNIEDDLAHMQEEYAGIDEQLSGTTKGRDGAPDESRILDVVTRAQARVRDRQLDFHGTQWKKSRAAVLTDFAARQSLEPWQVQELQRVTDEEIEEAVELLARPESAENPEQVAADWQRRLDETDAEAMRVLQGPAAEAWMAARLFERQLLWPWLPSLQPKTN
jgi:hypothetical protein